jgi:molecular chaperone DnaK (HSP70)
VCFFSTHARYAGLDYDEPVVQLERKTLQYDVGKDEQGYAVPVVEGRMVSPEEVGTFLLRRLKTVAQEAGSVLRRVFGFKFKSVTVSVPVSFTHEQRAATIRAASKAGFSFVRVIEEPIAAAIAYGLDDHEGDRKVVVYDFGGGTLDVALLRLDPSQGAFMVIDRAGDPHLGGEDFDTAIAQHFNAKIKVGHSSMLALTGPRKHAWVGLPFHDALPVHRRPPGRRMTRWQRFTPPSCRQQRAPSARCQIWSLLI